MIYFIQEQPAGAIKIGCAGNPQRRLYNLQTGNHRRLRILGVIDGGREHEIALHRLFKRAGYGEWFRPSPALMAYIKENARPFANPSL
jgi:hypothetical protein